MKRAFLLSFFLFGMKVFAQPFIPEGSYFECASEQAGTGGRAFTAFPIFHFVEGFSFYAFSESGNYVAATSGTYRLTLNRLEMFFSGYVTYRHTNDEQVYYSDSVFVADTLVYEVESDSWLRVFNIKSKTCECRKTEANGTGWAHELFPDYSPRLEMLRLRNSNHLQGLDRYHSDLDTAIMKAYLAILDSSFYYYKETDNSIWRFPGGMYEAGAFYPSDSAFKLFSFSGEDCGASCNGRFTSIVQFPSGKFAETEFFGVFAIYKTGGNNEYIVLQRAWSGGTMSTNSVWLNLVRLENDSLFPVAFEYDSLITQQYLEFPGYQDGSICMYSYWYVPCNLDMVFDPSTNKIHYSQGFDFRYNASEEYFNLLPKEFQPGENEALCVEGEFILQGNKINAHKISFTVEKLE